MNEILERMYQAMCELNEAYSDFMEQVHKQEKEGENNAERLD